jgi:hypothetical protein
MIELSYEQYQTEKTQNQNTSEYRFVNIYSGKVDLELNQIELWKNIDKINDVKLEPNGIILEIRREISNFALERIRPDNMGP